MTKHQGEAALAIEALVSQRGLKTPPISNVSRRAAIENQLYIYNVAPWPHRDPRGTLGSWYVPAREEGQRYSLPCIVPGVIFEAVYIGAMGDGKFENREHEGILVAYDILGLGMHQAPDNSVTNQGIFLAEGPEPTEEELVRAEARLRQHYEKLLVEADAEFSNNQGVRNINTSTGPKVTTAILSQHIQAAKALGVKRPWLGQDFEALAAQALATKTCEACNAPYTGNPAFCPNGDVLDEVKARKSRPWLFAEEKRGPGRPPNSERA